MGADTVLQTCTHHLACTCVCAYVPPIGSCSTDSWTMCVVLCCAVLRFALRAWAVGLLSASGGDQGQGHHPVPIHVPGKVQRRHCGHHLWPCNLPGRCVRMRVRVRVCAHVAGTKDREVRWKGGGGGGFPSPNHLHLGPWGVGNVCGLEHISGRKGPRCAAAHRVGELLRAHCALLTWCPCVGGWVHDTMAPQASVPQWTPCASRTSGSWCCPTPASPWARCELGWVGHNKRRLQLPFVPVAGCLHDVTLLPLLLTGLPRLGTATSRP